jgi:hypothetical protein
LVVHAEAAAKKLHVLLTLLVLRLLDVTLVPHGVNVVLRIIPLTASLHIRPFLGSFLRDEFVLVEFLIALIHIQHIFRWDEVA